MFKKKIRPSLGHSLLQYWPSRWGAAAENQPHISTMKMAFAFDWLSSEWMECQSALQPTSKGQRRDRLSQDLTLNAAGGSCPSPIGTNLPWTPAPFNCAVPAATAAAQLAGACRGGFSRAPNAERRFLPRAHRSSLHFNLGERTAGGRRLKFWKRRQTLSFSEHVNATLVEYTLLRPLFLLVSVWRGEGQPLLLAALQTRDFPSKSSFFPAPWPRTLNAPKNALDAGGKNTLFALYLWW